MANKSYVSLSMMPLDDLAEFLQKVKGFNGGNVPSNDTKKVDSVDASKIAVAALDANGDLVSDRKTVENALKLGGVDASSYVTTSSASALLSDTYQVAVAGAQEIKAMRDELYQMKSDLTRKGVIESSQCYNGFIDPFRDGKLAYDHESITTLAQADNRVSIADITVVDGTQFTVGEYICIESAQKHQIARIDNIQGNRLTLGQAIDGPLEDNTFITRTTGQYNKGTFIFGRKVGSIVSPKIKQMIVKDWKVRKRIREITRPNSGFVSTVIMPISMSGVIRSVTVSLGCTGAPGSIKCVVYRANTNGYEVLAESQYLSAEMATVALRDLDFTFNTDLELESTKEYMFAIISSYGDDQNKWFIGGYDEPCPENIHKDCYDFLDGNFVPATDDSDMFLCLGTSEIQKDAIAYDQKGVYTCNMHLDAVQPATRVRCELVVGREGRFKVVSNPTTLVPGPTKNLELENEDSKDYGALGVFQPGTLLSVGNSFAKVGSSVVSNEIFKLDKEIYAPADAKVSRIGYKVIVKATKTTFVPTSPTTPIQKSDTVVVELPLVAVIPSTDATHASYRLIFEGELKIDPASNYKLEQFNEIQTQVYWESLGVPASAMSTYEELSGKILELVVSTDNAYNKKQ